MDIASKIWYTWALFTILFCLTGWLIDEDKHPLLFNVIAVLVVIPIVIGLTALFVYVLMWIWK